MKKIMKHLLRYKKDENGQGLVEFAIILPLFLLLVMGIIQFGIILNGQITLTSASREGARLAVVTDPNEADADNLIRARVDSAAVALLLDINQININRNVEDENGDPTDMLSVSVVGEVPIIVPVFNIFTGSEVELTGESKMRIEYE